MARHMDEIRNNKNQKLEINADPIEKTKLYRVST